MKTLEEVKEEVLDLSGLMCPLPIVLTSEKMRKLKEGQTLTVISTDPGFERDVYNWCAQSGNELISLRKEGDRVVAVIRKSSSSKE
ncbi:MAG: sulfurtransferase TusA family protein, partial [Aquificota bacterium]